MILQGFQRARGKQPDLELVFVGDGEDRPQVVALADALGVSDAVHITGYVDAGRVVDYLNAAHVCAVGSHMEGWSMAMLEMLACGKAIVSTDVSGARDMIRQGENGCVVDGRDPGEFADALLQALTLTDAGRVSLEMARKFSVQTLARDLGALWPPLAPRGE